MKLHLETPYLQLMACQVGVISFLMGAYFHSVIFATILFALLLILNWALINSLTYARYSVGVLSLGWFSLGLLWGIFADGIWSTTFVTVGVSWTLGILSARLNGFLLDREKL